MLTVTTTIDWHTTHPGGSIGLLELSGIANNRLSQALNARKREIETSLRQRYAGFTRADFAALPVMAEYIRYYKRFGKTYHVLQQLESIALKGKNLPNISPLVDANFAAEVETLVLAASHAVEALQAPLRIDVARPGDTFTQMGGEIKTIPAGDMVMRDAQGLICSILYGQDNRSPVTPSTTHVLYVAYAPAGVPAAAVEEHLRQIHSNVLVFSPVAVLENMQVLSA